MSQLKYALMIWPTDKNLMNIRPLDNIVKPKKLFNDYEVGDECLCVYPGFMPGPDEDGLWRAIILATAGTREELKPVLTRLVNESRSLIPDVFTCEMVTQIMIDLALTKETKSNQTGKPKEGSAALTTLPEKNATDNKKRKGKRKKNEENQKTPTSKDKQKTIAKKAPMGEVRTNQDHKEQSASKQRKITKSLEAIAQDEAFLQLEKDLSSLETNQPGDSASTGAAESTSVPASETEGVWAAENQSVFDGNTLMDLDVSENIAFSQVSDALRTSSAILYGAQQIENNTFTGWNEPTSCQGCVSLGNKVELMRHNFDILWNEVKKLQEMVDFEISQRKQICGGTLNVVSQPSPSTLVLQSSSAASTSQPSSSVCASNLGPSASTSQPSPSTCAQETNHAAAELETAEKLRISSAEPNKIYNGYTVEQLEREAKKEKDFSKAAKRLLVLMFTEEERAGRCLMDFRKTYKKTGITVVKKGLADQGKLAALQEIILRCYTVVGGRSEINRKLIEKLKPSASKI